VRFLRRVQNLRYEHVTDTHRHATYLSLQSFFPQLEFGGLWCLLHPAFGAGILA
jgi:hypothetical protein